MVYTISNVLLVQHVHLYTIVYFVLLTTIIHLSTLIINIYQASSSTQLEVNIKVIYPIIVKMASMVYTWSYNCWQSSPKIGDSAYILN